MSLKGVRKAIVRTPHQLIGKRLSVKDDELISLWEHDLTVSVAGLRYIQLELSKYHQSLKHLMKKEVELCKLIRDEEYDENDDQLAFKIKGTSHYQDLMNNLSDIIDRKCEESESNISYRCHELISYLEKFSKMLTKRNHKKMDVEIHSSNVQKQITKNSAFQDKDMQNLKKEQELLEYSTKVFNEIDEKVKIIVPEALDMLSELLDKLGLAFQASIADVYGTIAKHLEHFTRNQGLSSTRNEDIIKEWQQDFTTPKYNLDQMTLIDKYKAGSSKPSSPSFLSPVGVKIKKEAQAVGSKAQDTTSLLWKKTMHPRATKINVMKLKAENPVQPKSPGGIFATASESPTFDVRSPQFSPSSPSGKFPMTPDSPGMSTSPWLKPLSLKRQQLEPSSPSLKNETLYEEEQDSSTLYGTTPSLSDRHQEFQEIELREETRSTTTMTTSVQQSVDALIDDIKRIRAMYSRHSNINLCPVTMDLSSSAKHKFTNDDALRFQVAANSTLSSKLLRAHLDL